MKKKTISRSRGTKLKTDRQEFARFRKLLENLGMVEIPVEEQIKFYTQRAAKILEAKRVPETHDQISFSFTTRQYLLKLHTSYNPTLKDHLGKRGRFSSKTFGCITLVVQNQKTGKAVLLREFWRRGKFVDRVVDEVSLFIKLISAIPRCNLSRKSMKLKSNKKGLIYWECPETCHKYEVDFNELGASELFKSRYRKYLYYRKIRKIMGIRKTRRQIRKKYQKLPKSKKLDYRF